MKKKHTVANTQLRCRTRNAVLERLETRQLLAGDILHSSAPRSEPSVVSQLPEGLAAELRAVGTPAQLRRAIEGTRLFNHSGDRHHNHGSPPHHNGHFSRPGDGRPALGVGEGEASVDNVRPSVIRSRLGNIKFGPVPSNAIKITPDISQAADLAVGDSNPGSTSSILPGDFFVDLRSRPPQAFYVPPDADAAGARQGASLPGQGNGADAGNHSSSTVLGPLASEGEGPQRDGGSAERDANPSRSGDTVGASTNGAAPISIRQITAPGQRLDSLSGFDSSSAIQPISAADLRRFLELRVDQLSGQVDARDEVAVLEDLIGQLDEFGSDGASQQVQIESLRRLRAALSASGRSDVQGFLRVDGLIALDAAMDEVNHDNEVSPEVLAALANAWNSPIGTAMLDNWSGEAIDDSAVITLLDGAEEVSLVKFRPIVASATAVVGVGLVAYSQRKRKTNDRDDANDSDF